MTARTRLFATARARLFGTALARFVVTAVVLCACSVADSAATDPLAGVVLDDVSGRSWALDDLRDGPVLLVIADRDASPQAESWGARLAARTTLLAPWHATGKVAWVSIADLRRVPEYARDSARDRLRAQAADRPPALHATQTSPLLLDWGGLLGERFRAERGAALLILLARDRQLLARIIGPPSDSTVTELIDAIARAAPP